LAAGEATSGTWIRMVINYLVPFLVASVGYVGARRGIRNAGNSPSLVSTERDDGGGGTRSASIDGGQE
jgi:hypothetical protein